MDFVDHEASEASSSEESGNDSEAEIKTKKKKKEKKSKKKAKIVDSSEEEDEDDLDGNLEGFIDDDVVEDGEEGDEGSGPEGEKRKHEDSESEEGDLEDDDYDLLEENLGVKVQRKKKLKRIRVMSEDEDSHDEGEQDDRDVIAREIFDGDVDEGSGSEREEQEESIRETTQEYKDVEGSGSESEDNFIVDDDGKPIQSHKKRKHIIHDDQALQEAQDIFGVDFDFDEFDQYGSEYSEAEEEEEEEEEEYEDEEDEGAEKRTKVVKKKKKKGKKTTIFEMFEPSDLERAHFTDADQEIRTADMPERFQLRQYPVVPTEEGELDEEAEWIYRQAFMRPPVSRQDYWDQSEGGMGSGRFGNRKGPGTVAKIKSALNFMRNQQFEVPFIAFYRKEYVEPELNINDLWKVYQADEKWMQLRQRKQNLIRLFEKMQTYQFESIDPDQPLESHVRALTEEDIERVRAVQTIEEHNDVYQHFLLYYGNEVPRMKAHAKAKKKQEREKERQLNPEAAEEGEDKEDEEEDQDALKQASRKSGYTMCVHAGLAELARKYGLSAERFGENLRDNYQRHDVEQDPAESLELAQEFIHGQFKTPEEALKGAGHMVAMQIAHEPLVRQVVRQVFYERAMISAKPTKKGVKEVDENHPCYTFKYLKNKPVKHMQNEQFLHLTQAVEDGTMTYEIHMDEKDASRAAVSYFEEIRQLYHRDEFSNLVQEWNALRSAALERALNMILYPLMIREAKTKLLEEAKECITRACCRRLYNWLKVAPYQADQQLDEDDDEYDSTNGLRIMGVAFSEDMETASFSALIDGDGEVIDILRLPHIMKRKNARREDLRKKKLSDMEKVKDFISSKKPHVIAVAALSRQALSVLQDMKQVVSELEQEQQMAPINVELIDAEMAVLYSHSKKSEMDFREYPQVLRQAISVARRLQDPLIEFAQLCNPDEDILCLKYHPLQDSIQKETLMNALYLEFVNRVNEVGVDVNRCVAHQHTSPLVQFVCGLGPRKGYHLLKILKQNNSRLENRTQLVVMCHMGPKVFINCAGFIKIDTSALGDSTEAYVEVLDGSRVHPETYEWARKMAVDALEYDDTAEDANPAGALEEILENPERLKDLDLDAFADELERQGYGNKHITLYDIRAELNHRYKDLRVPYRSPTSEERFNMLTKETPNTFYIGKLVMCIVTGIAHRRPKGEQLDQANPVRNDETGLWQCPFCQKNDFPELSEVWNHFDAGECVGQAMGVKTRLDNGIAGFIHVNKLSDKEVTNPEDRVRIRMPIHARITKIDIDKFSVDMTSRTSDLVDADGKWKPNKDSSYDYDSEEKETKKEEDKKKQQARQTYVKRVIVHPQFHNVDYKTCVKLMTNLEAGDVIIRPSSKGTDHLTCTWKVHEDILQHIDIREDGKENAFSLGRSLWIGDEEFEDLDEIIARYVQPMSQFARDLFNYKYYRDSDGGKREVMDKLLFEEKKKAPSKIPYYFSVSRQFPGKFMLSYLPRKTPRHEFVTVTPEGIRYRGQIFHSVGACIRWFKEHFKDPIPGATPAAMRTPHGGSTVGQTPNVRGMDSATLQRAAAGLPNSVFNTLAQVAGQTPMMGMQNPLQTPLMTPMMTPNVHPMATPSNHPYVTPGQAFTTPAGSSLATPALQTPQYQPTPRAGQWPQAHSVGGRTPQVMAATPVTNPSGSRTPQVQASAGGSAGRKSPRNNPSSTDWAKMAEMWAKRKTDGKRRTPRQSPYGGSTPGTPRGDSTPLFDE